MRKVIKKEYIPNSRSFKLHYSDGGIGYGADPSGDDHLSNYVASMRNKAPSSEDIALPEKQVINEALQEVSGSPFSEDEVDLEKLKMQNLEDMGYEMQNGAPVLNYEESDLLESGDLSDPDLDERKRKLIDSMTDYND